MANLNNATTFQLAQTLNTTATTIFLAVNQHNYWQPLQLAILDLQMAHHSNALVGWAYESPNGGQEGSVWWLLSGEQSKANQVLYLEQLEILEQENFHFFKLLQKLHK